MSEGGVLLSDPGGFRIHNRSSAATNTLEIEAGAGTMSEGGLLLSDPGGGLRIHNRISAATNTLEIEPTSRVAFIAAASIRGCQRIGSRNPKSWTVR